ncbi:ComF family protein [Siphonobacter sp. SORGH_AS_0500]|uniref:ComF family protein n=1 Tax=Siphonobacter sp. SORGH_AS_0500 TaxID=1864824 RepID=UPI0028668D80|nr:ComF family protein [Siphonobacter sp. SORGH_AS_0500]MDR6193198.1 ComF family protein [Siphonobacter sp. SORGH_AS_0500]
MKSYWKAFWALLFPRICLSCQQALAEGEYLLCTTCHYNLPRTQSCLTGHSTIEEKFAGKIKITSAHAYLKFQKGGKVQHLLHQLKYNNQPEVGEGLGRLFGSEIKTAGLTADLLLPVPLHESRLRQRGYNQSDSIAKGISEVTGIPWRSDVLQKVKATTSQTNKSRMERFQNVANAFQVIEKNGIENQRIALIDDVITTGSTLETCAEVLLEHGCKELHIWTLATAL